MLFLFSFVNTASVLIFMVGILALLYQREIGAIKIINLLIFRTIINPGFAVDIGFAQNIKWVIMLTCAIYLLFSLRKLTKQNRSRIKWVLIWAVLFAAYNFFVAYIHSSFPVVASFKNVSYTLVFLGILIGIAYTIEKFDWLDWITKWFALLMIFSLLLVPFPVAYLINGISFQGALNHPNMFGIIAAMFLCLLLVRYSSENTRYYWLMLSPITLSLILLSRSRTALITSLVLLFIYFMIKNSKKLTNLRVVAISFISAGVFLFYSSVANFLEGFILKGQASNILYSRQEQVNTLLFNFQSNPWFGTGFSVPYFPQFRFNGFSMDFVVEPGNLVLAVLSYCGIIGFTIFVFYMLQILLTNLRNSSKNIYLFLTPFFICMGEMVFFSSNSIGVFCYMFLALYIYNDKPLDEKVRQENIMHNI